MKVLFERLKNGIVTENPIFVQVLAMCPILAVTSSVENAVGMGIASTVVLIFSNMIISALRKFIPNKIRIPAIITIYAGILILFGITIYAGILSLYQIK